MTQGRTGNEAAFLFEKETVHIKLQNHGSFHGGFLSVFKKTDIFILRG